MCEEGLRGGALLYCMYVSIHPTNRGNHLGIILTPLTDADTCDVNHPQSDSAQRSAFSAIFSGY